MSLNRKNEYKKFLSNQESLKKEYERLGLTEEQIIKIQELDKQQFLSNMRYYMHNQALYTTDEDFDDYEQSPLFKRFLYSFMVSQDPLTEILNSMIDDEVIKAIKSLSPNERKVFVLKCKGYSVKEIHQITGSPIRTIYYRENRIKKKMKKSMKKLFPNFDFGGKKENKKR